MARAAPVASSRPMQRCCSTSNCWASKAEFSLALERSDPDRRPVRRSGSSPKPAQTRLAATGRASRVSLLRIGWIARSLRVDRRLVLQLVEGECYRFFQLRVVPGGHLLRILLDRVIR